MSKRFYLSVSGEGRRDVCERYSEAHSKIVAPAVEFRYAKIMVEALNKACEVKPKSGIEQLAELPEVKGIYPAGGARGQ